MASRRTISLPPPKCRIARILPLPARGCPGLRDTPEMFWTAAPVFRTERITEQVCRHRDGFADHRYEALARPDRRGELGPWRGSRESTPGLA